MIPFAVALFLPILLISVLVISGLFLLVRWLFILGGDSTDLNTGDMKVPTFYSCDGSNDDVVYAMMPVVGVVFGGIHCIGWYFNFPSSGEAVLWRVSSAVLTGIAFLFPLLTFLANILGEGFFFPVFTTILLVYVMSRLLLLVEAFISLRHLTSGMLAIVKWTSFIPHI